MEVPYAWVKGTFLSEDTDAFVINPKRQKDLFLETENLNFGYWKSLKKSGWHQKFESLEPQKGKKDAFGWLRQP